jgi:hypothetical protein
MSFSSLHPIFWFISKRIKKWEKEDNTIDGARAEPVRALRNYSKAEIDTLP